MSCRAFTSCAAWLAAIALGGCPRAAEPPVTYRGEPRFETGVDDQDLQRALQATVLENYGQLTLGNIEAYGDGVARQREVALIGVEPGDAVIGTGVVRERDPRPYRGERVRVLARNLDVHLSPDRAVGWVFDELSLRVPHEEREAAVPLRMSALFVRDIDRWVMVVEHLSYPLSAPEILDLARAGALRAPARMTTRQGSRDLARLLRALVVRTANLDDAGRAELTAMADRRATVVSALAPSEWLSVFPGHDHERRGAAIYARPSLAELFGDHAAIEVGAYRLSTSRNRQVAWMVANLRCVRAGERGDLSFGLRGTFVFARDQFGWAIVQSHVSVPVTRDMLDARVFGEPHAP